MESKACLRREFCGNTVRLQSKILRTRLNVTQVCENLGIPSGVLRKVLRTILSFLLRLRRRKNEFLVGRRCQKLNFLEVQAFLWKPENASKMISTSWSYLVLVHRARFADSNFLSYAKRCPRVHRPRKSKLLGSGV